MAKAPAKKVVGKGAAKGGKKDVKKPAPKK
jgi:hypothetical protein